MKKQFAEAATETQLKLQNVIETQQVKRQMQYMEPKRKATWTNFQMKTHQNSKLETKLYASYKLQQQQTGTKRNGLVIGIGNAATTHKSSVSQIKMTNASTKAKCKYNKLHKAKQLQPKPKVAAI
ncbi:unnamed protein product [Lathyrus oleraceus]